MQVQVRSNQVQVPVQIPNIFQSLKWLKPLHYLLFRITFRMGMTFRSTFNTGDFKGVSKEDLKGYFEAYFKGDLELEGDLI